VPVQDVPTQVIAVGESGASGQRLDPGAFRSRSVEARFGRLRSADLVERVAGDLRYRYALDTPRGAAGPG
jgi:hypothetical protein